MDDTQYIRGICERARVASRALAKLKPKELDVMLEDIALRLEAASDAIVKANEIDLRYAAAEAMTEAMRKRLVLDAKGLRGVVDGVRQVASLPQPLGEVMKEWDRPNGMRISKVRVPIGVIGIIYESRPNVTIDAAVLCLKTGNAVVLRGGKEAANSNQALVEALQSSPYVPKDAVQLITNPDRALVPIMCQQSGLIDLLIPRGGKSLIQTVVREARVPVIKHADGICSVFVHKDADQEMATRIILNAKVQKPSVCNAAETVLVDRDIAKEYLPKITDALGKAGVIIYGDETVRAIEPDAPYIRVATDEDYATEYLDLRIAMRVVDGLPGTLEHMARFSSQHSDTIVTENAEIAEQYLSEVDSATVYWNASTRFTDGAEFGFGAEIGISTDKLHARGPMGLEELTSYKYIIRGTGQIR